MSGFLARCHSPYLNNTVGTTIPKQLVPTKVQERTCGATADEDGKLPAVGPTVDPETANYVNSIGSASFATTWTDPAFNPHEAAFYYVRVIQIPTPRWTTYDAKFYRLGDSPREVIQGRAYSSPIWYTP